MMNGQLLYAAMISLSHMKRLISELDITMMMSVYPVRAENKDGMLTVLLNTRRRLKTNCNLLHVFALNYIK